MPSIISAGTTSGTSLNLSGDTSGVLQLATNGSTTAVTISTGQLVGIGTTSPDGLLTLPATASNTPKIRLQSATSDVDVTISSYADSSGTYAAFGSNAYLNSSGDEAVFDSAKRSAYVRVDGRNQGAVIFGTAASGTPSERARVDFNGNFLVNTSVGASAVTAVKLIANSSANTALQLNTGTSGGAVFSNNTGNGFQIYGYTGAIGSESYNKVMENAGVGTSIAIGGASSVSGVGITFPATQSASSNANTLDDYEEGTWTPAFVSVGGTNPTITYASRSGYYTKIGNTVNFQLFINNTAASGGTNTLGVTLPFATSSASTSFAVCYCGFSSSLTVPVKTGYTDPGQSNMFLQDFNAGSGNVNVTNLAAGGGSLMLAGTYFVN